MCTFGGGVQVPVARHWAGDVGYRYSHIAADTALSAGAIYTNAITFGSDIGSLSVHRRAQPTSRLTAIQEVAFVYLKRLTREPAMVSQNT